MSLLQKLKIAYIGLNEEWAANTGELVAAIPLANNSADATVTRALDTATRVNSAGNIESVVANRARIDYSLGTDKCPNLLVERNVVNILTQTQNYADYYVNRTTPTDLGPASCFSSGSIARFVATATDARFGKILPVTSGLTYTVSAFYDISEGLFAGVSDGASNWRIFNILTGTLAGVGSGSIVVTCTSYQVKGNIYRVAFHFTALGTTNYFLIVGTSTGTNSTTGADKVAAGYFQLQTGLLVTSYIPATTVALTKNADVIQKTGISSLIPQTKGTLLFDGYLQAGSLSDAVTRFGIEVATDSNNRMDLRRINNNIRFAVINGGVSQAEINAAITSPLRNKRIKLIGHFDTNNFNIYINGLLSGNDSSGTAPNTSIINLGGGITASDLLWDGLIKAAGVAEELTEIERDQFFQYDSLEIMAGEMQYQFES